MRRAGDFWRRWHISLSTWFRDYVYIPLGGSRAGRWKASRNILVTFLVSGLWHGASWNYVLWGGYHGVLLRSPAGAAAGAGVARGPAVTLAMQTLGMFVLVNIGWLMFRETETAYLFRDLTLSPFGATAFDRQTGAYLFLIAFIYSLPFGSTPLVRLRAAAARHQPTAAIRNRPTCYALKRSWRIAKWP